MSRASHQGIVADQDINSQFQGNWLAADILLAVYHLLIIAGHLMVDYSYIKFMDDPFLSEFIVRFVFTLWVLSRHAGFKVWILLLRHSKK